MLGAPEKRGGARICFRIGPALREGEDHLVVPEPVLGLVPHQVGDVSSA